MKCSDSRPAYPIILPNTRRMQDANDDKEIGAGKEGLFSTPNQSPCLAPLDSSAETTPRQKNTGRGDKVGGDDDEMPLEEANHETTHKKDVNNTKKAQSSKEKHHDTSPRLASLPLPKPRDPEKCPLFCCFYAEFDNKVGPTICFQSPKHFMDQEIGVSTERVHEILAETFDELQSGKRDTTMNATNSGDLGDRSSSQHDKQSISSMESNTLSIFDSCSEYIITGSELTGKVINLSTHEMHLLTRPTVIVDDAYERNSLLFSVGFVLRRSSDPRPFQPVISKLAQMLREMELESQYLSNPATRNHIQSLTEQLLVSLNSRNRECNLYISPAHVLQLKLFHPPRIPASPVPDFAVPVLLVRDWRQCQAYYDWDLSIDWCARHIDGVRNARQLSEVAEVDMEIVRACLRVLKHHGVIALCDMFFYSNRYEATERAIAMLAGKEHKLLEAATEHAIKILEPPSPREGSPLLQGKASSPATDGSFGSGGLTIDRGISRIVGAATTPSSDPYFLQNYKREDFHVLKLAVAEFYSKCERSRSFGDTWIGLVRSSSRNQRNGGVQVVDWKRAFLLMDHRRLASFGVVHGLIRRIHRFPRVIDPSLFEDGLPFLDDTTPPPAIPIIPDQDSTVRNFQRNYSGSSHTARKKPTVSMVGKKMDGSHCDDELCCEFEKPLEELLHMVGMRNVFIALAHATAYSDDSLT